MSCELPPDANSRLIIHNSKLTTYNSQLKKVMAKSLVYDKSLAYAVRIVNLYKYLREQKRETSIGANVSEALNAESDFDFIHKLAIAQKEKEVNETTYWLSLLEKTEFLTTQEYQSMSSDTDELRKMIASIILTKKENIQLAQKKQKGLITHNS